MDGQKDGWMNRWTDRLLAGWMDRWTDGRMDGLQLWLAERSNPAAFCGSKWGVSAPQHNQGVEAEKEGDQERGAVGTSVQGEDVCPRGGCSRQGHCRCPHPS